MIGEREKELVLDVKFGDVSKEDRVMVTLEGVDEGGGSIDLRHI